MIQEDKDLLLRDLCGRLPYRVMIKSVGENKIIGLWDLKDVDNLPLPYLRPMSSMTEEEERGLSKFFSYDDYDNPILEEHDAILYLDWLNKKMFDYRGLIEKGLAIEAPERMYVTD